MRAPGKTFQVLPGGRAADAYDLQEQVGFILRKANQRHLSIFAARISDLTPPQFAALAKLHEVGATSQNQLGQMVAMDAATIKGVIDRLKARGLVELEPHGKDRRRLVVSLSEKGRELVEALLPEALEVTEETLAPLTPRETATFLRLLTKLAEG
ncbi:MarR family winged helix-turn-helix transcriptional regulator [Nitratireductor sp. ZSWI3]|uniref:MarR family winged helix-turn-helix transcriptional regulator n=1 Tax=Nitratireductor sp. ZSWI3 TaxID=2966359 RepID=UPI00214FE66A|nr:MarR family transcriptional regulator [Nitratireductor sp. ZSWI3]MCR4265492.1 MarR family transcriptional regulator [Nitratireductor sp. ZSWI3]